MDAPRIVIGLPDEIAFKLARDDKHDAASLRDIAISFGAHRLAELLADPMYAHVRVSRLVDDSGGACDPGDTLLRNQARLEDLVRTECGVPVPTLLGFFVLEPNGLDQGAAEVLLRRLRWLMEPDPDTGLPDVATAYVEQDVKLARATAPGATGLTPPGGVHAPAHFNKKQVYVTSRGINLPMGDANADVRRWQAFDGTGIRFIDIEEGWNVQHEALVEKAGDHAPRHVATADAIAHGDAALGIVLASGAGSKIRGIAPGCTLEGLYALQDEASTKKKPTEAAIRQAVKALHAGDVLLLELETTSCLPVEVSSDVFAAIRLAAAKGIIVIEPAGNDGSTLEKHRDDSQLAPAWTDNKAERRYHGFPDSRAIIVGGCEVVKYHGKYDPPSQDEGTRGGARVDCCAWSQSVWTSFSDQASGYGDFNGTSSASAIIAGLAIIVQQYAKARLGRPLTPEEMRGLLRDPDCGSPVASTRPGYSASMPDACKLFKKIDAGLP